MSFWNNRTTDLNGERSNQSPHSFLDIWAICHYFKQWRKQGKKKIKGIPSLQVFSQFKKEIKAKWKNYYNIGVEGSAMMETYKKIQIRGVYNPIGADTWAKP